MPKIGPRSKREPSQSRLSPSGVISATFAAGTIAGQGRGENLSRDGLFARTPVLLEEGEPIRIILRLPTGPSIEVTGEVRWNSASLAEATPPGFGVALFDYGSDYSALLGRVIRERDDGAEDREET